MAHSVTTEVDPLRRNSAGIPLPAGFPCPTPRASDRSARLQALIRRELDEAGGTLSFARYMELCLYAPGLGYYRSDEPLFGPAGDFVTAPEISTRFGACLARPVSQLLAQLGVADLLEAGAGTGRMAADLLGALERDGAAPRSYQILEPSGELRARQAQTLTEAAVTTPVEWLDDLPPNGFRGVVVANEVLDAMPAYRFVQSGDTFQEARVERQGERFGWRLGPIESPGLETALAHQKATLEQPLDDGYVSELSLLAPGWIGELGLRLERGGLLLIDYGHARRERLHRDRRHGTLACHYRHRLHDDPFLLPGLQDLSTHVDFSAIAEAAVHRQLEVSGYTTQANFLLSAGLLESGADLDPATESYMRFAQEVRRLTLPGEMGELVKVMLLTRACTGPFVGFEGRDLRGRL